MFDFIKINDLNENKTKKILFLIIGILIFVLGFIILKFLKISDYFLRKILSTILMISCGYFLLPVIFLSFLKPIIIFKNGILHFLFSMFFIYII